MRKRSIALIALVAVALGAALVGRAAPGDDLVAPIAPRQTLFSIPFTLPPAATTDQQPAEVRLFVSADYGANWSVGGRVDPRQASFTYRAPRDGEYWFAIRAVDKQGHFKPENVRAPELRVIVDTLPPRLELQAARNPAGEIVVHWLAVDPLLKADTLKIEYQVAGESPWHAVQFEQPRDDPNRSTATGEVAWRTAMPGKTIIRAEIRDRADNTAVSQATVGDGLPAAEGPALGPPTIGVPTGPTAPVGRPSERPSDNDRHDLTASTNPPLPAAAPPTASTGPANPTLAAGSPGSANWPTDRMTFQPVGHSTESLPSGDKPVAGGSIYTQAGAPATAGPIEGRINPAITDRVVAPVRAPATSTAPVPAMAPAPPAVQAPNPFAQGLPPGERPYMVNSRKFALEYEVESIGAAGVAKIETWGTSDGGRTWTSYGVEPSRQGPVRVAVEGEGLYGFRITVQDANGLGGRPPKSGDLPELWVGVDLTKPVAKLTAIDLGAGEHSGELAIRWEASDAMLATRPISLLFAERLDGPWTAIAAGLDNAGLYNWRFDNRVPDRIFLRLEVRDEAGNVGEFQTAEPISLAANRAQLRIRSVRPIDGESARGSVYRFYR